MQFSRSSSLRIFCSDGLDTMHVLCTELLCVVCIELLCVEFLTVNTGLGRPMFWKLLYLLCTSESLASNLHRLLLLSPKSSTLGKKLTRNYQKLKVTP